MYFFASPPPCPPSVDKIEFARWLGITEITAVVLVVLLLVIYLFIKPNKIVKRIAPVLAGVILLAVMFMGYLAVRYAVPSDDWCSYQDRYDYYDGTLPRVKNPFPWDW